MSHRFVGRDIDFEIADVDAMRVADKPMPVVIEAMVALMDNRPPHRFGMRLTWRSRSAVARAAAAGSTVITMDERRYGRLRWRGRDASARSAVLFAEPARVHHSLVGWLGTRTVCSWRGTRRTTGGRGC